MIRIFVILIVLSILFGLSIYIAHRIYVGVSSFASNVKFWPFLLTFAVLALVMLLGFAKSMMPLPVWLKNILGTVGLCYMGIFVYLLLYTLLADIVMILPQVLKLAFTTHQYFKGFMTLSVLALTLVTCTYGFINARQIDHVSYDIQLRERDDISDINIVMISDLHLGSIGSESRLENIVDEINSLKPDVVCIVGDFFDSDFVSIDEPEIALAKLRSIRSTYGVYACLGNHDAGKTFSEMLAFLDKADIRLLDDDYAIIDNRFVLVGRLDRSPIGSSGERTRREFSEVYKRENPKLPVVVMDHNPAGIGEYGVNADLILCGHTHKGQLFPASIVTNAMYDVDYGYYRKDAENPHVIVSSGVGYWGMPMRVGTDCEIVSITIKGE